LSDFVVGADTANIEQILLIGKFLKSCSFGPLASFRLRQLVRVAVCGDGLEIIPDCGRNPALVDQLRLGLPEDVWEEIPELRKDALVFAVVAGHAGIEDLGEVGAGLDFIVQPGPDEPHPSARGIGVPPESFVGWAVKIYIIFGEFTISTSETTVDDLLMFYIMYVGH
jgi:hypothetical protein